MGLIVDYQNYILIAVVIAILLRAVSGSSETITRNGKRLRNPPDTLPFVGNGIKFLQSRWDLLSWFDKCQRQFGYETVALSVPTLPPGVLIHSPQNLEFVFKNEGLFAKGEFFKRRSWDLFGNGIINADGDLWKVQRKAGLAFLNTANLRVLTDVALPQYLSASVEKLKTSVGKGPVDLQTVFHEITTNLMGKMAYNMEMHADDEFSRAFDFASGATAERFQNPLWQITEIFTGSKFRKSTAIVKAFGRRIVSSAVKDRKTQKSRAISDAPPADEENKLDQISGSLIQSLLDTLGDEDVVADAALTYLSAGRDTTGQALTWTFYLLLQHPDVVSQIRREIATLLSHQVSIQSPSHNPPSPTPLDLPIHIFTPTALPYTLAVFLETLRLYPPIPFEIRESQSATTLPDGTFLPPKSILLWCLWAMQRSRVTWGEDADVFRPERFLDEEEKLVNRIAAEFPVFYGGARTCLGRKMAEAIAVVVIPVLVWEFEFEKGWDGEKERRSQTSLTLPMEGGLPVLVRARKAGAG
ncbi:hypothetical protein VTI74DRAFT_1252 [Chaetomium olivicolor]